MSALFAPNAGGAVGDVARAVSPQVAYRIGQYFKENNQEGSASHLLAHAILGAAVSAATGNDVASGALAGATSEATAPVLANYLYNAKDPKELSQEQKDTITSIITLGTAGIAYGATGDVSSAVSASEVGKVGVENNAVETAWDVVNVGIGTASFGYNISKGNYGAATIDGLGLAYDVTATAVPFLPAGASAGVKAYRAGNNAQTSMQIGFDVATATNLSHKAARDPANIAATPRVTGSNIHRSTAQLLGESNGGAAKLSSNANSYFKGSNGQAGKQPDMSWSGTGMWADLTTSKSWSSHTRKYNSQFGQGIPILYETGKGVTNYTPLKTGAGVVLGSTNTLYYIHNTQKEDQKKDEK